MDIHTTSKALAASAVFFTLPFMAMAGTFEIEENFDDDSHFTTSATLPDGWESTKYKRIDEANTSVKAKSAPCMLGSATTFFGGEVLYTPMMEVAGNSTFRIEFKTRIPGGTPPSVRNFGLKIYAGKERDLSKMELIHTREPEANTDWEDISASFVTGEEGEYCFAIETFCELSGGGVYFDDFFFSGTEKGGDQPPVVELEPNPDYLDICEELAYTENFSDPTHYDGVGVLPIGWVSTGSTIWRTASIGGLSAYSGEYYMVSPESSNPRDEKAYTPFFNLQAGTEYTLSFESHFSGYLINGEPRTSTLNVSVGTEQDYDFHPLVIGSVSRALDDEGKWTHEAMTFTPTVSGPYCFAFALEGERNSGFVAIDNVTVSSALDTPRPEPSMFPKGVFSYQDNHLMTFPGIPVRVVNMSKYATSYEWDVPGAKAITLPDGSADLFFYESGDYEITLNASNSRGSRSATRKLSVTLNNVDTDYLPVIAYDPSSIKLYQRGEVPSHDTDPNGLDYITGVNHYYRTIAERYDLPGTGVFTINEFVFYLSNLRYVPRTYSADDQRLLPVSVVIYGADEDGNLDESKEIWRKTMQMGELFSDHGFGSSSSQLKRFEFDTKPQAQGTIYVAFEFDELFEVNVADKNVGRSFISLNPLVHFHGISTTYAKPFAVPEGTTVTPDGKWYRLNEIEPKCGGIGLFAYLNTSYKAIVTSNEAIDVAVTNPAFTFDGTTLSVANLSDGDIVAVYGSNGSLMLCGEASNGIATLRCTDLPAGIYVVSTPAGAFKFVK